jgi:glycosyltransferase involved in cell wall biosynthesis
VKILHVAPFDASRYPPLINTVHVTTDAGAQSRILASVPVGNQHVFGEARVDCPTERLSAAAQQAYLFRGVARERDADVVIFHNLRGLLASAAWAPFRRARLVYHCHDYEFDERSSRPRVAALMRAAERALSHRVDQIWVPADERLLTARERGLSRPMLVKNCPRRLDAVVRSERLRAFVRTRAPTLPATLRVIVRHGNVGAAHCIYETVEAVALLPRDVVFVVVGEGDAEYAASCRARAEALGVADRFHMHPFVAHSELLELIAGGDVASGLYAPLDINAQSPAPNKVYESMAVGMSVIVTSGNSTARDVVEHGAGLAIGLGDPRRLAEGFAALLASDAEAEAMRRRARAAHLAELNYEVQLRPTLVGAP